jgi:hypothetical protein
MINIQRHLAATFGDARNSQKLTIDPNWTQILSIAYFILVTLRSAVTGAVCANLSHNHPNVDIGEPSFSKQIDEVLMQQDFGLPEMVAPPSSEAKTDRK